VSADLKSWLYFCLFVHRSQLTLYPLSCSPAPSLTRSLFLFLRQNHRNRLEGDGRNYFPLFSRLPSFKKSKKKWKFISSSTCSHTKLVFFLWAAHRVTLASQETVGGYLWPWGWKCICKYLFIFHPQTAISTMCRDPPLCLAKLVNNYSSEIVLVVEQFFFNFF